MNKSSKFNLSDGEDDDYFGSNSLGALPANDDFEDEVIPDDDDDAEAAETKSTCKIFANVYHCTACFVHFFP